MKSDIAWVAVCLRECTEKQICLCFRGRVWVGNSYVKSALGVWMVLFHGASSCWVMCDSAMVTKDWFVHVYTVVLETFLYSPLQCVCVGFVLFFLTLKWPLKCFFLGYGYFFFQKASSCSITYTWGNKEWYFRRSGTLRAQPHVVLWSNVCLGPRSLFSLPSLLSWATVEPTASQASDLVLTVTYTGRQSCMEGVRA